MEGIVIIITAIVVTFPIVLSILFQYRNPWRSVVKMPRWIKNALNLQPSMGEGEIRYLWGRTFLYKVRFYRGRDHEHKYDVEKRFRKRLLR